jgi:hydrogenase maturation protease
MTTPSNIKPILILGVGNTLLRDEGVGVHVVQRLQTMDLPEDVEVLEGGVLGLDLLEEMENREKLIIVDAVQGDGSPGTTYRLTRKEIEMGAGRCLTSLHEIDLPYVLHTADLLGQHINPIIIGVEPKDMGIGLELSPEIEAQIPKVIDLVLKEIGR